MKQSIADIRTALQRRAGYRDAQRAIESSRLMAGWQLRGRHFVDPRYRRVLAAVCRRKVQAAIVMAAPGPRPNRVVPWALHQHLVVADHG